MEKPSFSEFNKNRSFLDRLKPFSRLAIAGVLAGVISLLPASVRAEDNKGDNKENQRIKNTELIKHTDLMIETEIKMHLRQLGYEGKSAPYPLCLRKSYGRTCALADNSDNKPNETAKG